MVKKGKRAVSSSKPPSLLSPATSISAISSSTQVQIDPTPVSVTSFEHPSRTASEASRITRSDSTTSQPSSILLPANPATPLPTDFTLPISTSSHAGPSNVQQRLSSRLSSDAEARRVRTTNPEESRKLRKKRPESSRMDGVEDRSRSGSGSIMSYETGEIREDSEEGNRSNEISIEEEVEEEITSSPFQPSHGSTRIFTESKLRTPAVGAQILENTTNLLLLPYKLLYQTTLFFLLPLTLVKAAISSTLSSTNDPTKFNRETKPVGIVRNVVETSIGVGIASVCITIVSIEWLWKRGRSRNE